MEAIKGEIWRFQIGIRWQKNLIWILNIFVCHVMLPIIIVPTSNHVWYYISKCLQGLRKFCFGCMELFWLNLFYILYCILSHFICSFDFGCFYYPFDFKKNLILATTLRSIYIANITCILRCTVLKKFVNI